MWRYFNYQLFFGWTRFEFDFGKANRKATQVIGKHLDAFKGGFEGISCNDVQKKMFSRSFNNVYKDELNLFLKMGGHNEKCQTAVGLGAALEAGIIWDELNKKERFRTIFLLLQCA